MAVRDKRADGDRKFSWTRYEKYEGIAHCSGKTEHGRCRVRHEVSEVDQAG